MIPVLEVGGTHVTAALVDLAAGALTNVGRVPIDSGGTAEEILDAFAASVASLGPDARGRRLAVAIPGPFDYERGIGQFQGVAKFGSLNGVPVGDLLRERIGAEVVFLNDVTAYALGQYVLHGRPSRLVALTLGTGVGSCFLAEGVPVEDGPTVPPHGWAYLLHYDARPIEDTVSRRAIIAAYRRAAGEELDVSDIAVLARADDPAASGVLSHAFGALAETIAPWLVRFGAEVLVVGGSITKSWDLAERWFVAEVVARCGPGLAVIAGFGGEEAALLGAARFADG